MAGAARSAEAGQSVVVVDWRADWIGLGIAERLARAGRSSCGSPSTASPPADAALYVRDAAVAALHTLGVAVMPYMRLYGADAATCTCSTSASGGAVVIENRRHAGVVQGPWPQSTALADSARSDLAVEVRLIGDAAAPRTAEEAIYEGLGAGAEL